MDHPQTGPDGQLLLTGTTSSSNFPTTPGAFQTRYAGPELTAIPSTSNWTDGDLWLAKLDPAAGMVTASTFLGGPENEQQSRIEIAADGSISVQPVLFSSRMSGAPVAQGALYPNCASPCQQYWAARLNPALSTMLSGTYLPLGTTATVLHADNTLYITGTSKGGLPTTPGAYQSNYAGRGDAFLARLDPSGSRLLFATYYGGPDHDTIYNLAVASDGSAWLPVGEVESRIRRFVRLSSDGARLLAQFVSGSSELILDRTGVLHAIQQNSSAGSCSLRYLRYNESGAVLSNFAILGASSYSFTGLGPNGIPILRLNGVYYQADPDLPRKTFLACAVSPATFQIADSFAPGMFLTLFGEQLGPAATKVFINGWDAPVLYSSENQVNVLVPFELSTGQPADIEVEAAGNKSRLLRVNRVEGTAMTLFPVVLNQDGSVNSAENPAEKGSIVVLWGTGGANSLPASSSGEITPLTGRPLNGQICVSSPGFPAHEVLYAGFAPGAIAGLIQINIRLHPNLRSIPGESQTAVRAEVTSAGSTTVGTVRIYHRE